MKTFTKILLAGGVIAAGAAAVAYYRGIENLWFKFDLIKITGINEIGIGIQVYNPSCFTYPVPRMWLNITNAQGEYIGTVLNTDLQVIGPKGATGLAAWVIPQYATLGNMLSSLIGIPGQGLQGWKLKGVILIKNIQVPVEIALA